MAVNTTPELWTHNTFTNFIAELVSRDFWVPKFIFDLVKLIAVWFEYQDPYVQGNDTLPPAYCIPFCHRLNYAELKAHWTIYLGSKGIGKVHAQKFGFALHKVTIEDIDMRKINSFSNDWWALYSHMAIDKTVTATGSVEAITPTGDMFTNKTTSYTSRNYYFTGNNPSFLNRCAQFLSNYVAVNNLKSIFVKYTPDVAEKVSAAKCAIDDTSFTQCGINVPGIEYNFCLFFTDIQWTRANFATIAKSSGEHLHSFTKDVFYASSRDYDDYANMLDRLFEDAVRGQIQLMG